MAGENQPPASRTQTVVVDRRTVTKGYLAEQGAVPKYVPLYRPASGLPRQTVGCPGYEEALGAGLIALGVTVSTVWFSGAGVVGTTGAGRLPCTWVNVVTTLWTAQGATASDRWPISGSW